MVDPSFQPGKAIMPTAQVDIAVSCKNLRDRDALSKSDPIVVLFMKDFGSSSYHEVDRTEQVKNNLNPEFAKRFQLDYRFEEAQRCRFDVYDVDSPSAKLSAHDFLGSCEITLGELMSAPGSQIHRKLVSTNNTLTAKQSSIIITGEEQAASKKAVYMQLQAHKLENKDFLGKSDPFLQVYRKNRDGTWLLVHRSEVIKNNLNPVWKPFKINMNQLCQNDDNRPIRIDCSDYDSDGGQAHDLIGSCEVTLRQLLGQGAQFDLTNPKKQAKKKDYKNSGRLAVMQCTVNEEFSFLDYIRGGTQIHFTVAIDFTASNGDPKQFGTLHYIDQYRPNQYMVALKSVGEICQDYDTDKMFPALGFGARLPNGQISHEFFLNFHPSDPHCHGIEGILNAYRNSIMQVQLYGPTNFSPVIQHVARFASASQDGAHYFVLLIITDGVISDLEQTIASIVQASALPMSIIIVGVGNADFDTMEVLDADKGRLGINGRYAERDIVQDVHVSQAQLAKCVLAEVPVQCTTWMAKRGVRPRPPPPANAHQLAPQSPVAPSPGAPGFGGPTAAGGTAPQQPQQSGGYPPQQGAYPPQQQQGGNPYGAQPQQPGGYPQQSAGAPGYPPQQSGGYPSQPAGAHGYPPQQSGGYPPQSAGAPGYPPQQPGGYPSQSAGAPGYPPQQSGGYPPQSAGAPGYPPQQSGGYPPQSAGAPGYPPQQGHPPNQGYPPQQWNQSSMPPGINPGAPHGSPYPQL